MLLPAGYEPSSKELINRGVRLTIACTSFDDRAWRWIDRLGHNHSTAAGARELVSGRHAVAKFASRSEKIVERQLDF